MPNQNTNTNVYSNVLDESQKIIGKTVYEFFMNEDTKRSIPVYQRPYSWEKNNILDYLNDLKTISNSANESSWFLGSIFSTKHPDDEQHIQLLDGQQRITTIQIVLWNLYFIVKFDFHDVDPSVLDEELRRDYNDLLDKIKSCLIKGHGNNGRPRFTSHNIITEVWDEMILRVKETNNSQEHRSYLSELKQKLKTLSKQEPSAKRIFEVIDLTKSSISEYISNDVIKLVNFSSAILDKCWLLEIVLKDNDSSLKIFEALNNRGKELSLSDKLRYKCLTNCSKERINDFRDSWKKIYSDLDYMIDKKFVKNEDDFFKVFMNIIDDSEDLTKAPDIMSAFEKEYLVSDNDIERFIDEVLKICKYHKIIMSINNEDFMLSYESNSDDIEITKIRALFFVFKNVLLISDNSRLLFYKTIKEYYNIDYDMIDDNINSQHYSIFISMFNIIKKVLLKEIILKEKSNETRTDYLSRSVIDINNGDIIDDSYEIGDIYNNFLFCKNNYYANLILTICTYLKKHDSLIIGGISYSSSKQNREHLIPQKWETNWGHLKNNSENDLKRIFKENQHISIFGNDKKTLKSLIESNIEFEFSRGGKFFDKSIGQMIGNMLVLHKSINTSISNKSWLDKKSTLTSTNYLAIPPKQVEIIGIESYTEFTPNDIINRSFEIWRIIRDLYDIQWNEVE